MIGTSSDVCGLWGSIRDCWCTTRRNSFPHHCPARVLCVAEVWRLLFATQSSFSETWWRSLLYTAHICSLFCHPVEQIRRFSGFQTLSLCGPEFPKQFSPQHKIVVAFCAGLTDFREANQQEFYLDMSELQLRGNSKTLIYTTKKLDILTNDNSWQLPYWHFYRYQQMSVIVW